MSARSPPPLDEPRSIQSFFQQTQPASPSPPPPAAGAQTRTVIESTTQQDQETRQDSTMSREAGSSAENEVKDRGDVDGANEVVKDKGKEERSRLVYDSSCCPRCGRVGYAGTCPYCALGGDFR